MAENSPTNIVAAFDILLEEIETENNLVDKAGETAFSVREYDKVEKAHSRALQITDFREKVNELRREWESFTSDSSEDESAEERNVRRNLGRLKRGLRTREEAYYQPILQALQKLGGSASMHDVLAQVHEAMKPQLREVDFEPLASDPDILRWRNTAQWARSYLVKQGLMKSNSRRGIWEITDEGVSQLKA